MEEKPLLNRREVALPATLERKELEQTFLTIRRLFDFAQKNVDSQNSYDTYVRAEKNTPPLLPENLKGVTEKYPGDYFVVYYTDRNSSYYKEGTRGRTVGLSTSPLRSQSNKKVREIEFKEPGSDTSDPQLYMTVSELVNEKSFTSINMAGEDQAEEPYGSARITYAFHPGKGENITHSEFVRLDEGLFEWGKKQQPVRWLRKLIIETPSQTTSTFTYEDSYIIGRWQLGKSDERAQVRMKIKGDLEKPELVQVEIGLGGGSKGQLLFEDKAQNIRVVLHPPIGTAYENELKILSQDPNYASLLQKENITIDKIRDLIVSKINLLRQDWDKPQGVFGTQVEYHPRPQIES